MLAVGVLAGCPAEADLRPAPNHENTFNMRPYYLTLHIFSAYSRTMDAALDALAEKIQQTADLAKRLRAENIDLRQRIVALETEKKRLAEKVDTTAQRLETLIKQLPE